MGARRRWAALGALAVRVGRGVRKGMNRPACASLAGVLVGCTPLRRVLVLRDAPLRFMLDAMALLGAGAIPLIVFVLGSTLSSGPEAGASVDLPRRTMLAAVAAKLLVVPAVNLCLTYIAFSAGLLPRTEALLPICLVIVGSSPTAMNLSTIAALAGAG